MSWWTDIRDPLVGTAVGALAGLVTGGLGSLIAGSAFLGAGSTIGAVAGGTSGLQSGMQKQQADKQLEIQKAANRQQEALNNQIKGNAPKLNQKDDSTLSLIRRSRSSLASNILTEDFNRKEKLGD